MPTNTLVEMPAAVRGWKRSGADETAIAAVEAQVGRRLLFAIDQTSVDVEDNWRIGSSVTESLMRLRVQPHGPWD